MTGVIEAVLAVFDMIGNWIGGAFENLIPIFWTATEGGAGSLTFMGVLAVAGLAISVVLLLLNIVQRFLHFRG